jgi:hypothetical protein
VEYNVESSEFVGLNADEVEALIMLRDDIRCSMEINAFGAFVSNEVRDINIEILPKITDIVEGLLSDLPTNEQISAEAIAEELSDPVITTPFDENVENEVFSADSAEELNNELPNNDDVLNTNATDNESISPAVEGDDTSGELPPSDDEMALQREEPQNENEGIDDETPIPDKETPYVSI